MQNLGLNRGGCVPIFSNFKVIFANVLACFNVSGGACLLTCLLMLPAFSAWSDEDDLTGPQKLNIDLSGTAVELRVGDLRIEPAVFDTGRFDIGQSTSRTVTLTHTGDPSAVPIVINEVQLFGANADEYSLDSAGFVTLFPGDTQTMTVTFMPTSPGDKSAGVKLNIQDATNPHVILVEGEARYPLTSSLVAEKALDFGQTVLNKPKNKTLVLTNSSDETDAPPITVQSADLSGDTPDDFSLEFSPVTLAAGESTTLTIAMSSALEGRKEADLMINHTGVNAALVIALGGDVVKPTAVPVNFTKSNLNGANINNGTSLQFGPDDKLYVSQMDGKILVYDVQRNGKNNYQANLQQTINNIHNMDNRNDDGNINSGINGRLITGILVTGSAANPIIYTHSSDPRQAAGPSGTDSNLDTNSGIIHKLTKNGNNWNKIDLVRGLPRSEENHQGNGMVFLGNKLLMSQGGHTNQGAPSNNFARLPEYALSSAILEIDVNAIGNSTYDLPTLDDEDRPGANDANDPFGGNNGKNQAILENNGPVEIYASGLRNAYDLVLTENGKLYTVDNGPNAGWGGNPLGNCTDDISEGGSTYQDGLHLISGKGYYGGHPNPTRGSKNNKFNNSNPQSPIEGSANPEECNFKIPQSQDGALTLFGNSTNGLDEYTASNFGGAMQGDLVIASFSKIIRRVQLNDSGTAVTSKSNLFTDVGGTPLDLVAQGDNEPFPGTIWVVDYSVNSITVLEPADY